MTSKISGTILRHPNDTFGFLEELENSEFIECNYTRAFHYFTLYHTDKGQRALAFKQKARQLLLTAKTVLDAMGIPFWLSSGTCLGLYEHHWKKKSNREDENCIIDMARGIAI